MLILYIIIAIYVGWMWVDYFRLIDVYNKEKLLYLIIMFAAGAAGTLITDGISTLWEMITPFKLNGQLIHDIACCIFKVGMVEELSKIIPFLIILKLLKKQFNEPIDYLAFISISALGFASAENVRYFSNHGAEIINSRAILCTIGHMFDTSLFGYGIIRYKYKKPKPAFASIFLFFAFAVLSHAFYDFWLMYEGADKWGFFVTLFYFMITVSLYATMLNNCLNNSSLFSYKKLLDSYKISSRMFTYFGILYGVQFVIVSVQEGMLKAFVLVTYTFVLTGFIIIVSVSRLSRFKLIQGRWENLKFELPFTYYSLLAEDAAPGRVSNNRGIRISIKGEPSYYAAVNEYIESFCYLNPLSLRNSTMEYTRLTYIEKLIFTKNDERIYVAKLYQQDDKESKFEYVILKPKLSNFSLVNNKYTIVAIFNIDDTQSMEDAALIEQELYFQEWAFMVPEDELVENEKDLSKMF